MLTGKQKRYLRAMASGIDPILQVGKAGTGENLLRQLDEALTARELVKVRVLPQCPGEVRDVARCLIEGTDSELVQVIGRTLVLYRRAEEPKVLLP